MADPIDYTAMSDDELFAQVPRRAPAPAASTPAVPAPAPVAAPAAAPVVTAPASVAPAAAAAPPAPASTPAAAPDFSKLSDDELLAQVPARAAPTEPPTAMGELGRQLELTGRGVVKGAIALPGMLSDAITGPINAGLDAVAGEGNGFRFQKVGAAADNLMTAAGVAEPKNSTERVVQDIVGGVAGTGSTVAAGNVLASAANKAAGPISKAVGKLLSADAGTQIASTAAGAGASGITRESGGGAVAQTVAGLAGAAIPSAVPFAAQAATKGALRGGEAGRRRVEENIRTFESAAGTTPTMGQATQSRTLQAAETGLSNVIGGAGVMIRRGEAQAKALQDSVQEVTDALAPSATGADAGAAITKGVNAFRDNMKSVQQRLYADLDQHIPSATPVGVSNTQRALEALNEGIPGAPNISQFFKNGKLSAIEKALVSDLQAAAKAQAPVGLSSAGMAAPVGQLPYEAVQKLRSLVGREIADGGLTDTVPRSKWRALYAALSDDLGGAAAQAGPAAQAAWARANRYTKLGMERLDQLDSIVSRDAPEKVFKAATTGLAEGGTQISRLMKSMPVDNRREVAAAVLQRLGRARPGQQNELGDAFSSETFLTNLAAMSPPARRALFGSSGFPGLEQKVTQMGRMASIRRDGSQVFANPSGTARQAGMFAWAGALTGALASGNMPAILGALGAPVAANIGARLMTNPERVRALARRTELSAAAGPTAIAAAARVPTEEPAGQRFKARIEAERARRKQPQ